MQEVNQPTKRCEKAWASFVQEALDSWQAYQETGEHLSLEELQGWLDSWGYIDGKST